MAVRHGYGKLAGTDALVFAYDTGDTVNSYRGEPTTNYLVGETWHGDGANQASFTKGAVTITDPALMYKGYSTVLWSPGTSSNCYLHTATDIPPGETSTVWTFSCYVRREDGGTLRASDNNLSVYLYYPSSDGSATGTIQDVGNGWYRVSRTRTGAANYISLAGFTGFASGYKYYLSGWMLEKKDHPTPSIPINTTRSNTQGLLDLTGNTTIDLSNVSFDSNAQMTFDGTDDIINLDTIAFDVGDWTFEAISNSNSELQSIITGGKFQAGLGYFNLYTSGMLLENSTDTAALSTAHLDGNYHHLVGTVNRSTKIIRFYVDGELVATNTAWNGTTTTNLSVGIGANRRPNSTTIRFHNGKIPIAKIYNRALTAQEVQSNYQHYKTRFNLS